jgi:ribosomal-protein-alanine N-acetyltransferase
MLKLTFKKLDIETIHSIAKWRYDKSADGLYIDPYLDSYIVAPDEMKGPGGCDGYGVYLDNQLFGLFEYTFVNNELVIGCALEPTCKGRGYGAEFVSAGISFGVSEYQYKGSRVILDVDVSNIAARNVYDKVGFEVESSSNESIRMVLE